MDLDEGVQIQREGFIQVEKREYEKYKEGVFRGF